jgi:hypothetical protein
MDEIAMNSNVISPNDWRKVSLSLIRNNGGQVREILNSTHLSNKNKRDFFINIKEICNLF